MQPTMRLRFIEREQIIGELGEHKISQNVRILQQWWEPVNAGPGWLLGEWRDVPLEV